MPGKVLTVPMGWGVVIKRDKNTVIETKGLGTCIGISVLTEKFMGVVHLTDGYIGSKNYEEKEYFFREVAEKLLMQFVDIDSTSYVKIDIISGIDSTGQAQSHLKTADNISVNQNRMIYDALKQAGEEIINSGKVNLSSMAETSVIDINIHARNYDKYGPTRYKLVLTPKGELFIKSTSELNSGPYYPEFEITQMKNKYPSFSTALERAHRIEVNAHLAANYNKKNSLFPLISQLGVHFLNEEQQNSLTLPTLQSKLFSINIDAYKKLAMEAFEERVLKGGLSLEMAAELRECSINILDELHNKRYEDFAKEYRKSSDYLKDPYIAEKELNMKFEKWFIEEKNFYQLTGLEIEVSYPDYLNGLRSETPEASTIIKPPSLEILSIYEDPQDKNKSCGKLIAENIPALNAQQLSAKSKNESLLTRN